MNVKMKSKALLCVLTVLIALLCACTLTASAEDQTVTDSKTVIMEYTGEPIDVSLLFDTQPDGAIYTVSDYVPAAHVLDGTMMTVTTPGSFRVSQTVGEEEIWISLGVYYTLTVNVKDQSIFGTNTVSSTKQDVESFAGLQAGHTVEQVTLVVESTTVAGGHDAIKAIAVVVKEGELDVSSYYNVKSVNGALHHFSAEWATNDDTHFFTCASLGCELKMNDGTHVFDSKCDARCDVCGLTRDVPDHEWTKEALVIKEATETEAGEKCYFCLNCNATRSEVIPMLESTPVFLIVCVAVSGVIVVACLAVIVVRSRKKKAVAAQTEEEEKTEE